MLWRQTARSNHARKTIYDVVCGLPGKDFVVPRTNPRRVLRWAKTHLSPYLKPWNRVQNSPRNWCTTGEITLNLQKMGLLWYKRQHFGLVWTASKKQITPTCAFWLELKVVVWGGGGDKMVWSRSTYFLHIFSYSHDVADVQNRLTTPYLWLASLSLHAVTLSLFFSYTLTLCPSISIYSYPCIPYPLRPFSHIPQLTISQYHL